MKPPNKIVPLPFSIYFWPVAVIALSGLLNAVYLTISHYRIHVDIGYQSFCAISKTINCDTVSQSAYAVFLNVPLAFWGVLGYLIFLILLFNAYGNEKTGAIMWPTLFLISFCFSFHSIVLALISSFIIKSYCIMCIASYGVNFMLLFYTYLIYKRFGGGSFIKGIMEDAGHLWIKKKKSVLFVCIMGMSAIALILFFPKYWNIEPTIINNDVSTGITDSGHPWIGAEQPELVITEFADYQCFQCRKMHYFIRQLISKYPGKLRIVHRHFPMDNEVNPIVQQPFYVGSGKLAILSIFALQKNKFWEMNDLLYTFDIDKGEISLIDLAERTGLKREELSASLVDMNIRQILWEDIREGVKMGISGTPGYIIDDKLYLGHIPPEILKRVFE